MKIKTLEIQTITKKTKPNYITHYISKTAIHIRKVSNHIRKASNHMQKASNHMRKVSNHMRKVSNHTPEISNYIRKISKNHIQVVSNHLRKISANLLRPALHIKKRNTASKYFASASNDTPTTAFPKQVPPTKSSAKFRVLLFISILLFCCFSTMLIKANALQDKNQQPGIAEKIIRFHVIANSDSNADQQLKLTVKDTLVRSLSPILKDVASKEEARTILIKQLGSIKELAEDTIKNHGYYYPVTVSLEECYFPLKIYGEYSFPPGYYEALRVQIGQAEGKNWWCVLFPPLCFVDETYSIVDESSGDKLEGILTEDEYDTLINKKTPVKIKFKLFESIKKLFQ